MNDSLIENLHCSIIVNTYNRESYLRRLLPSLERLEGPRFEIVVVNGPSTDGTAMFLAEYGERIKIINCPERNLSQSRNLGIAAAAGDIVVFIDDDALPANEFWLSNFVCVFEADTEGQIGVVGGPVLHRDTDWYEFDGGATSEYGFQRFQSTQNINELAPDATSWVERIPGGNCAFRRSVLIEIGGFDEFFVYYMDETDICMRLVQAGYKVAYIKESPIRHYSGASDVRGSAIARNWYLITRSDTYYAVKNSSGFLPKRVLNTLRYAPRKHFYQEINGYLRNREITRKHWLKLLQQWVKGIGDGLRAGVYQKRSIRTFSTPPPFLPFYSNASAQKLRIAILMRTTPLQPGYGGIARYSFDLAVALHMRGHIIDIFCADEQALQYYALGFTIHGISAEEINFVNNSSEYPILNKNLCYSEALVRRMAKLHAQGINIDVVHASNWDAEAAALIRANVYPTVLMLVSPLAQIVVTEQWQMNDDLRTCIALDRWQIEHAHAVCVPSQGVLESYTKLMGINDQQIKYLYRTPLGIIYHPSHQPQYHEHKILLFVGRCERRKGAHVLLEVLPTLLQQYTDWECHFVGNDQVPMPEGDTLKERFLKQHAQEPWIKRVFFHGAVAEDELYRHYASCDLFVAPSLFESFGLIYHEAMQYGKAVVGCYTGGIPEVVEQGLEGLLVQPDDAESLVQALTTLMSNQELREKMGRAGAERIHYRTNYYTMAANLEEVYLSTIARHNIECAAQRCLRWPRSLPILTPDETLVRIGSWQIHEAFPGQYYLQGHAHAVIRFQLPTGSLMRIIVLRHAWSGILVVETAQGILRYIDCYIADSTEHAHTIDIELPYTSEPMTSITLRVHSERNPASYESIVWIRDIQILPP